MRTKLLFLLGAGLLLAACASENGEDLSADSPPEPDCDTANVTYALTVVPLLQNGCIACHNNSFAGGGVNLSSHASVRAVATSGRLLGSLDHKAGYAAMPQGSPKWPACDINQLRQWIANGTPNN